MKPHDCDEHCRACVHCYREDGDPGACDRLCRHAATNWPDEED